MKKNIAVVGAGLQGVCVAYALYKMGYEVELVETNNDVLNSAVQKLRLLDCYVFNKHNDYESLNPDDISVLVSCAPYVKNIEIHNWCCDHGVKYCDLGGNPVVSAKINEKADQSKCQTFVDLGLAPGLANIISERLFFNPVTFEGRVLKIDTISINVGGLPFKSDGLGSLKYGRTFNIGGLTNEYSGYDSVLIDGEITKIKALSGIEHFSLNDEFLESFYTKGGLGLSVPRLKDKGLLNYSYRTIRYEGHCSLLNFLLEECCLSPVEFEKAMINATPPITNDKVYIYIKYMSKCGISGCIFHRILNDENWTAMQKATAFPTAVIAGLMSEDKFKPKGSLNYSHLSGNLYLEFTDRLKKLGINID